MIWGVQKKGMEKGMQKGIQNLAFDPLMNLLCSLEPLYCFSFACDQCGVVLL
jgi:hypothetical protein